MYFEVMEDGTPLRKRRYVFSEGFAAIAMSEYAIASGDHTYAEKALELFKRIMHFLNTPGILEPKYLDTLKSQGHSITMILVNTASRIRAAINDPLLTEQIDRSIKALRIYRFYQRSHHQSGTLQRDGLVYSGRGQVPQLG